MREARVGRTELSSKHSESRESQAAVTLPAGAINSHADITRMSKAEIDNIRFLYGLLVPYFKSASKALYMERPRAMMDGGANCRIH